MFKDLTIIIFLPQTKGVTLYPNQLYMTKSKTIKFPEPLFKKIVKLAKNKDWSFHKTVLLVLKKSIK